MALELRIEDFKRVARTPKAVICGLIPQFILLPDGTWLATLWLDLPHNVEAAMILVAACPGGSLSNVVTHMGRGNTALSVSISAVASIIAPGLRADLNAIDPHGLSVSLPQLIRDLPANGKRFVQRASGYVSTWVAGEQVQRQGEITNARPGQLVRMK